MINKKISTYVLLLLTFFTMFGSFHYSFAQVSAAERAQLEAELKKLEADIVQKQKDLKNQKGKSSSLSSAIVAIQGQIDKAKLNIKSKNLQIIKLTDNINSKESEISELENKLSTQKDSLSQLILKTNELDNANMIHLVLSGKNLSDFYTDVDSLASLKKALRSTVLSVKEVKVQTEEQKNDLEQRKDEEFDAKTELERAKKKVEKDEVSHKQLLSLSKNKEKEFEKILTENQKKAAQIKTRLFSFAGGNTAAIPFGTALSYAESAQNATGTPAAFTLAILTQESALGANVGKCYLTDTNTGSGINVNGKTTYPNVMKPTRDVQPFIEITNSLGINYSKQVVSCPIAGVAGWGGAMGPAQFIASTWKGVSRRVAANTGSSNPWNARDAIFASAIYLSDLGAGSSASSQIKAACRYYGTGGSSCSYGSSVIGRVSKIQADIDYLKQYGTTKK